jgi:hypothetical protein
MAKWHWLPEVARASVKARPTLQETVAAYFPEIENSG